MTNYNNKRRKTVTLALFTAMSLILFVVEMQIPPLTPIPGIKLGLCNIIPLFILHKREYKAFDAVLVVFARVLLAGAITGSSTSLIFSLCGSLAAILIMIGFRKLFGGKLIPTTSVAGALAHNITQVTVAVVIYSSTSVLLYLPILIFGAILSGLLTGFAVTLILRRLS